MSTSNSRSSLYVIAGMAVIIVVLIVALIVVIASDSGDDSSDTTPVANAPTATAGPPLEEVVATQVAQQQALSQATLDAAMAQIDMLSTELAVAEQATEMPAATDMPVPTDTPAPTATVAPVPPGEWSIQFDRVDDSVAVFVNGKVVDYALGEPDAPLIITDELQPGTNTVSFLAWNGGGGGSWDFALRQEGTEVWRETGQTPESFTFMFGQTLIIDAAGMVQVAESTASNTPPRGSWLMRIRGVDDAGFIVINGTPLFGLSPTIYDGGWLDIASFLRNDGDNVIDVQAWNTEGDSRWQFDLMHDDVIVWGRSGFTSGEMGRVFDAQFMIGPDGTVSDSAWDSSEAPVEWSARLWGIDDAAAVLLNGAIIGYGSGTLDWINISDLLPPGESNLVTFAAWNGENGGNWRFALSRDGVVVWGTEGQSDDDFAQMVVQQLMIDDAGNFAAVSVPEVSGVMGDSTWTVRTQSCDTICTISVNGELVLASVMGVYTPEALDITGLLQADQANEIAFHAWNLETDFAWDFALEQDGAVVWESRQTGAGRIGAILDETVTIGADGQLQR